MNFAENLFDDLIILENNNESICGFFPIHKINFDKENTFDRDFWKDYGVPLGIFTNININSAKFLPKGIVGGVVGSKSAENYIDGGGETATIPYISEKEHSILQNKLLHSNHRDDSGENNTGKTAKNSSKKKHNKIGKNSSAKRQKI